MLSNKYKLIKELNIKITVKLENANQKYQMLGMA